MANQVSGEYADVSCEIDDGKVRVVIDGKNTYGEVYLSPEMARRFGEMLANLAQNAEKEKK